MGRYGGVSHAGRLFQQHHHLFHGRGARILLTVYDALKEKGYNPISQIVGYILSEDPTYITTHNNARSLIRRIDRDELLKAMVRSYLGE